VPPGPRQADMVWRGEVTEAESETVALSALARQRSQTYWWLSELFLAAPNEAVVVALRERTAASSGSTEDLPLKDPLGRMVAALADASQEALAVEHARLFAGLGQSYGPPPPFESMHARAPAQDESIPNMVEAYRAAGFDRIDVPAVPQDHLAVELRFMALLAAQESAARDAGNGERIRTVLVRQQRFLDEHLLAWVPAYCARIATEARELFFAALADLTAEALALDRDTIGDLLRDATAT
jgi:putative dimethyl sulfoxide reductase chaperone